MVHTFCILYLHFTFMHYLWSLIFYFHTCCSFFVCFCHHTLWWFRLLYHCVFNIRQHYKSHLSHCCVLILLCVFNLFIKWLFINMESFTVFLCFCCFLQGINGILADEMGLGKTVQSIALLAHLAEVKERAGSDGSHSPLSSKTLWNCPLFLLLFWIYKNIY